MADREERADREATADREAVARKAPSRLSRAAYCRMCKPRLPMEGELEASVALAALAGLGALAAAFH